MFSPLTHKVASLHTTEQHCPTQEIHMNHSHFPTPAVNNNGAPPPMGHEVTTSMDAIAQFKTNTTLPYGPAPSLAVVSPWANEQSTFNQHSETSMLPLGVIQGVKSHVVVGIDWIRVTAPKVFLNEVTDMLTHLFGPWVHETGGSHQRGGKRLFRGKAAILYDDKHKIDPILCVELPGEALSILELNVTIDLLRQLVVFGKCTRIDTYVDFRRLDGTPIPLIEELVESCNRNEVCHAKIRTIIVEYNDDGTLGNGITIGRRGKKGSGRFLRVYDKGLEKESSQKGQWIRWEVEFTSGKADSIADKLVSTNDFLNTITEYTLGTVDFRENTGSRELARRPRANWWHELLGSVEPKVMRSVAKSPNFVRYVDWVRTSLAPVIKAMANESGHTIDQVFHNLWGFVPPHRNGEKHAYVAEYLMNYCA